MYRRLAVLLLVTVALGCSSDDEKPASTTGVRLAVEYDSSLDPDGFAVFAVDDTQAVIVERKEYDAPLFLEPPGLRVASLLVEVPAEDEMNLDVRVDAVVGESIVGSGRAQVTISAAQISEATVRLGAPTRCGDGRVHPTLESCDDGNDVRGDGCSDLCLPEPGWECRGVPSICTSCGNGVLEVGEACDDGNRLDGDGCSSACIGEIEDDLTNVVEVSALDVFTSTTPMMVPIPDTTLGLPTKDTEGAWLVLVSGSLGSESDEETDAVVRVMLDGEEYDRFGHQTFGPEDNDGGFMTFLVAQPEQTVHLELRTRLRAYVKDVRVTAAWMPTEADLHYYASDESSDRIGIDTTIDAVDITPAQEGEYVFLVKASVSEEPGDDNASTWVVGPNGDRYPQGTPYSVGRAPLAPMFVGFTERVGGDAKISIQGTSSGNGDTGGWWNGSWLYRRPLTVETDAVGVSASFTFDHANEVQAGRSRADGRDVRLVYQTPNGSREIARVVDDDSDWDTGSTRLWFRIPDQVANGGNLYLYYGNSSADVPPANPSEVFEYYHRFSNLTGWNALRGNVTINQSDRAVVPPGSAMLSEASYDATQPLVYEARMRFNAAQPVGPAQYWGLASPDIVAGGADGRFAYFNVDPKSGHVVNFAGMQSGWMPNTPDSYHYYAIGYAAGVGSAFFQDDFEIARFAGLQTNGTSVQMYVENAGQDNLLLASVRVRVAVEPAPNIVVGPAEGDAGLERSTWRHRRIVAFRTDAFDLIQSASMRELVSTTSTFAETVHTLQTEQPPVRSEYLVIQSAQIAGDSSATAPKSGVLTADGEVVLSTQHRITRDASATSGYHHVAGAAHRRVTNRSVTYANGAASPDGIRVTIADSNILVLRYAPR